MPQEWLKITNEVADRLSPDWLTDTELPLPDGEYVKQAAEWRKMSLAQRTAAIETIRTARVRNKPVLLFLLWTWEPSGERRIQIIRGFPSEDRAMTPRLLAKIFRHEAPDSHGKAVRDEVVRFLTGQHQGDRPTLGVTGRHSPGERKEDSLDSTLIELQALRNMNPWL